MSNQQNDIIEEDKLEIEYCTICHHILVWQDIMANMAIKHGNNTICKVCRRNQFKSTNF